jgi:pyruvate dehydrogenase (quinone)
MTKKVADLLVDVLAEVGVRRIYGVVGDSLNGITDSIRVKNNLEWVHVRHEEVAALLPEPKRISRERWPSAPGAAGRETCI